MKVGTDGTLIGAWATLHSGGQILDIGTGTGLIAIMAAQRSPEAHITAIDIDSECIEQARQNVAASPWPDRIELIYSSLQDFAPATHFDTIISNPPYFVSSLRSPDAARSIARHTDTLSFDDLTRGVCRLLSPEGHFALILPPSEMERFRSAARGKLFIKRCCEVWSTPTSGAKRIMAEFSSDPTTSNVVTEKLIIEDSGPQCYSEEYRNLTRDFYLKF